MNDNHPKITVIDNPTYTTLRSLLAHEDMLMSSWPPHLRTEIGKELQLAKLTVALEAGIQLFGRDVAFRRVARTLGSVTLESPSKETAS